MIGLGLGGRGHDTQTCQWRQAKGDQTNPVRPLRWRAPRAPPPEGNLANYKLLTKKMSNTWPFLKGTREWQLSDLLMRASFFYLFIYLFFCSAFWWCFVFVILAKFPVVIDIRCCRFFSFFFIQNKISIYTILSFLTMYRSAKKSTFVTFVASRLPALLDQELAERGCAPPPHPDKTVIKYAACFRTWPNFQGEYKY